MHLSVHPVYSYLWKVSLIDMYPAPKHLLDPLLRKYYGWGYDDKQYGLSWQSVKRARERLGLLSTRKQNVSDELMATKIAEIKRKQPGAGARAIVQSLRVKWNLKVPELRVAEFLKTVEPEAVQARKYQANKRRVYYTAGVMDVISVDQHDKWQRWQLYLHLGVEIYSGKLLWIKIWWTNRNPRLICSYYAHACRRLGGVPILTQSDPGTENYGIANFQTYVRQTVDPNPQLTGTLQHRWMKKHGHNIKPEIEWSVYRKTWSPAFEKLLNEGEQLRFYAPNDPDEYERCAPPSNVAGNTGLVQM
ncbi:hypothetical protein PM082_019841 [Marasmius tenuissimus]|nr:hypothetical protein PM082_019841 [Marasmius tenuissimus]